MAFQTLQFFGFLTVTAVGCTLAARRSRQLGLLLLLLACWMFYGMGIWFPLIVGTLVSAVCGIKLGEASDTRRRWLWLGVGYHLAILLIFKYTAAVTGGRVSLAMPLGISFFTFQQIWLLKCCYDGTFRLGSDRELLLYSVFFPTVTSGPILKPDDFFPQLREGKFLHPEAEDVAAGLYALCYGAAKKVLLADSLGTVVNNGWNRLADLTAPAAWLVILGYTLQLYFDFSGYCDMATGAARLLGIRLPINFDSPYRADTVTTFWKRWHITLTSFLRECVYFPLGGSRRGEWVTYRNILIVYLISGIWHGTGWTFLVWGLLHGAAQVCERLLGKKYQRVPRLLRWCVTFGFVNFAWIFFRAPDLTSAVELVRIALLGIKDFHIPAWLLTGLFGKEVAAIGLLWPALKPVMNHVLIVGLYGTGLLAALWPRSVVRTMDTFRPTVWRALSLALLMTWTMLSFSGIVTFIYSNF